MKRFITFIVTVTIALTCFFSCANAQVFDRTIASLRQIAKNNSGTLTCTSSTMENGQEIIVVVFNTDSSSASVIGAFSLEGSQNSIVSFKLLFFDSTATRSSIMDFSNTWNYDRRYPTVYLDKNDNTIIADMFLFTTSDCTVSMVDEFVENAFFGSKTLISEMEKANII